MTEVRSPLAGTVVSVDAGPGDAVMAGAPLVVLESMKMEHVVAIDTAAVVTSVHTAVGATVAPGDVLVEVDEGAAARLAAAPSEAAHGLAAFAAKTDPDWPAFAARSKL